MFPGIEEADEIFPRVVQPGSLAGVVVRVGGTGDSIPVLMESEGKQIAGCHTNRHTAKALAKLLFEPVRLNGRGYWLRDAEGLWTLDHFYIEGFEALDNTPLSAALTELRAIAGDWSEGALQELDEIRHGRAGDGSD